MKNEITPILWELKQIFTLFHLKTNTITKEEYVKLVSKGTKFVEKIEEIVKS